MNQVVAMNPAQRTDGESAGPALELRSVFAGYGGTPVLRDVSIVVGRGSVVALLGANGVGKSTLLRTASGLLTPIRGQVLIGGVDVTGEPPHRRVRRGLCLVPEGRGIFPTLTVAENLRMQLPPWSHDRGAIDRALEAFPDLGRRLHQVAGTMSGGQQQMLAVSRAWIARPKIVLLDEVSIGLAPTVVQEIYRVLAQLAEEGVALLIVEQYVNRALAIASHAYVLEKGEVTFSGPPSALDESALVGSYLGGDTT